MNRSPSSKLDFGTWPPPATFVTPGMKLAEQLFLIKAANSGTGSVTEGPVAALGRQREAQGEARWLQQSPIYREDAYLGAGS